MRLALGVEYNGSRYKGWEKQPGQLTVQGCLEGALTKIANTPISVAAAGRTDAGVHALGQVVHIDTEVEREPYNWMLGTNSALPKDISVHWVKPVSDEFHSRYSAIARRYRYIILNRRARPGVLPATVSWCPKPLDEKRMHNAAQVLLGEQDFSSFRAAACQSNTPMRRMDAINVTRNIDVVTIEVEANAFLHHMVRNIAGVLMAVGVGDKPVGWVEKVLLAKDRKAAGVTAEPYGLYLVEVKYPSSFHLPKTGSVWGLSL